MRPGEVPSLFLVAVVRGAGPSAPAVPHPAQAALASSISSVDVSSALAGKPSFHGRSTG